MEIKITKNGKNNGTVGDLAKGLESGKYKLEEFNATDGTHGLAIRKMQDGKKVKSWRLASDDTDTRKNDKYRDTDRYFVCDFSFANYAVTNLDLISNYWTPAAERSLRAIAEAWCEELNDILASEEPIEVKMIRVG